MSGTYWQQVNWPNILGRLSNGFFEAFKWRMKKIEIFEGSNEHTSDTLMELRRENFPSQNFQVESLRYPVGLSALRERTV